jgi:hypothetical protein
MSPAAHGVAMILARMVMRTLIALPGELLLLGLVWAWGVTNQQAVAWVEHPTLRWWPMVTLMGAAAVMVPLTLLAEVGAMRALGRVKEAVISRWSLAYLRV